MKPDREYPVIYKSQDSAKDALHRWQHRLLLLDWEIEVKIARAADFTKADRHGEVLYSEDKKMAIIKLLDPIDADSKSQWTLDHEKTLVHELIHLHLLFADPLVFKCSAAQTALEVAVDSLARGFVRLDRSSPSLFELN